MKNDLSIYERHAAEWWDPRSPIFRSLQRVNHFRAAMIQEWFGATLTGVTVVDLGCGGGLLAEPLMRAGARVVGLDLSHASLRVADAHGHAHGCMTRGYVCADLLHAPLRDGCASLVLLADVVEHVPDVRAALAEATRLLAPGGMLYVNTLNHTWRARILAVVVAEGIGLVPRGTHDADMFVSPEVLARHAVELGLRRVRLQGESVRVFDTVRRWAVELEVSDDTSVAYSTAFVKDRVG